MRIGKGDSYLSIESSPLEGGYPAFRAQAVASALDQRFTASHDCLMMDTNEATRQRFADFESLKTQQLEIVFAEDGWFRCERNSRGYIKVRYRIGGGKASAGMEGELAVEGQFAGTFCRDLGALLRA
jgi:hypothetical protein